jgi:dTDP-glucose 4,6-dehydratase
VATRGRIGESYNIGGRAERSNLAVVQQVCAVLDRLRPLEDHASYARQIRFVEDRPGHDRRYAIDPGRIERELGWRAQESFETGLEKTVRWYLDHEDWWQPLLAERYAGDRLGLAAPGP